jgi:lipopolysaccharide/colanic/teichoic acid biosynthesis glycosyltransferase
MRAIVIATGEAPDMTGLSERYPAPMLPLVDRPFIQHVVEILVDQGVTVFDFVLSHQPEKIEEVLGDGTRWGSTFRFHLARDPARPYKVLKGLEFEDENELVLLGHGDRLPEIDFVASDQAPPPTAAVLFCWRSPGKGEGDEEREWTGWAKLSGTLIASLPGELEQKDLAAHLLEVLNSDAEVVETPRPISVQSYEELLSSHRRVFDKEFSDLMHTGKETDEGIRLARNVSLHPTARLIAPVYVGENCRIGKGVKLGPNAAIGRDCVLDTRCTVENSVVLPKSYVGEALELADVIVDRNRLINVRLGADVSVADDFILGSLSRRIIRNWLAKTLSRLAAIVVLLVTWPILLGTALWLTLLRRGPVLMKKDVVRIPAPGSEYEWRTFELWSFGPEEGPSEAERGHRLARISHFLLRFLPAMINVVRGELRLVGVQPRSREEIKTLTSDWRALYLQSKAGVVTEAFVVYGLNPTEDELYSAEAFYTVTAGMRHDLKLLFRYFLKVLNIFSGAR